MSAQGQTHSIFLPLSLSVVWWRCSLSVMSVRSTLTSQKTALICYTASTLSSGDIFWAKDQFPPSCPAMLPFSISNIHLFIPVCVRVYVSVCVCIWGSMRTCVCACCCCGDVYECNLMMSYGSCTLQRCCNNPWIMAGPQPDRQQAHKTNKQQHPLIHTCTSCCTEAANTHMCTIYLPVWAVWERAPVLA